MRVACVNQDPGIGPERKKGAAVHLRAVRRALSALGAEVHAVDFPTGAEVEQRLVELDRVGPLDLVYERFALGSTAAATFAAKNGVPLVLEMNAPLSQEASRWRGALIQDVRNAERYVVERATKVLAVSNLVADYACGLGADPARVAVVPNGVDSSLFYPRLGEGLKSQLIPEGRVAVGFHGRLRPWHGFSALVEAAAALLESGLPIHLVIVGEGEFDAHIAGKIDDERVTRIGWVDHDRVGEYVATFDILPLSYSPESPCYFSPLKLMEAMACGVVPVVPELGDLGRVVEHGRSGIVYAPDEPRALRDALRLAVEDGSMRDQLAVGAVSRARAFQWEGVARTILEVAGFEADPSAVGVSRS